MAKKLGTRLLLSFCSLFFISSAFSQSFITTVTGGTLTTNQTTRKTKFQNLSTTQSLQVVQLGNLLTLQQQGILSVQVPGLSAVQQFKAKYVRIETNGDFTWIGDRVKQYLPDGTLDSAAYATITMLKRGTRMFGEMQIDDLSYQIKDLGQGLNALILMKAPKEGDKYCGTPPGTGTIGEKHEGDFPETLCPVKALVLYTQAALDANPDMLDIIDLSIAETNQAFLNSNISAGTLRMVLAGTKLLTAAEFTEVNDDDPLTFPSNSAINAYRAQYHADLVYIMTDDVYTKFVGAVTTFGDTPADVDSAFAIVAANQATTPRFVFAHETGHLFGARHQLNELGSDDNGGCPGGDNSGLDHAHGFGFSIGMLWWKKDFKTMMSICNGNSTTRLQSYSNPNVEFNGKKTGKDGKAFNAKILAFASCRVSHYMEDAAAEPAVAISTSVGSICAGQAFTVQAIVSNVPGTITYSWSTSLDDGVTYSTPTTTTTNTFTTGAPLSPDAIIFVRVTINNGLGLVLMDVKAYTAFPPEHCDHHRPPSGNLSLTSGGINTWPNPASSSLSIQLVETGEQTLNFQIMDVLGRVVKKMDNVNVDPRLEEMEIDISTLTNGLYWLHCDGAIFHRTTRFVCQH